MFGQDEREPELRVSSSHAEEDHAQKLQWLAVRITKQRKMSRSDKVLPLADPEHVGWYEVRSSFHVEDRMEQAYSSMV